ncbi:unnamed protein product [Musa textilis]
MHSPNSMAYCSRSKHPVPPHYSFGLWLTSILLFTAATTPTTKGCVEGERDALLAFKAGLVKDPSSRLSSWRGRVDCCRWSGVVCDNRTGHVVELNLQNSDPYNGETSIGGEIRPSLLLLTHLERLDLSHNDFAIPPQLGNLSSLRSLDLNSYGLSTDGLHWLSRLSSLRYLDMGGANLSMASHNWLQAVNMLSSLKELQLSDCGLTDLPSSLSHVNLTELATLDLHGNLFNSTFPNWLWKLHNLSYLDLSSSMFHVIPSGIGNLTGLRELHLNDNSLFGPIPFGIGNLTSLRELYLSDNSLTGPVPIEIGKLSNLIILSLSNNSLEGTMSELHFAHLTKLSELYLFENSLVISIDHNWVPPFQLQYIQLNSCKLGPAFPRWLRSQNSIEDLDMSNTSIEDVSPRWFWNNSASSIDLSQNQINELLDLSHNRINGSIPSFICNLTRLLDLKSLHLNNNSLHGHLSLSLKRYYKLILLDLGDNKFSGNIPMWITQNLKLKGLRLSSNMFSGNIPAELGQLEYLHVIDLSNNKLSGPVPSSFGNLDTAMTYWLQHLTCRDARLTYRALKSDCPLSELFDDIYDDSITLTTKGKNFIFSNILYLVNIIDLSNNNLTGEIPVEIGSLSALQTLNLSKNNFAGQIPEAIGGMKLFYFATVDKMYDKAYVAVKIRMRN